MSMFDELSQSLQSAIPPVKQKLSFTYDELSIIFDALDSYKNDHDDNYQNEICNQVFEKFFNYEFS